MFHKELNINQAVLGLGTVSPNNLAINLNVTFCPIINYVMIFTHGLDGPMKNCLFYHHVCNDGFMT